MNFHGSFRILMEDCDFWSFAPLRKTQNTPPMNNPASSEETSPAQFPTPKTSGASNPQPQMQLVCLIASVIKCQRRLGYFQLLLDSIRVQIDQLDGLIISIFIDPSLNVPIRLYNGLGGKEKCFVLRQKCAKKQFVQIQEMLPRVAAYFPPQGKETFLMFSDDDDLWHPERAIYYRNGFHDMVRNGSLSSTALLFVNEVTIPGPDHCFAHDPRNVQGPGDVQRMIDCGCVQTQSILEYHYFVVRPCVLDDFFVAYPRFVHNQFCDLKFVHFLSNDRNGRNDYCQVIPSHWLYFYRRIAEPGYEAAGNSRSFEHILDLEARFRASINYALDLAEYRNSQDTAETLMSYRDDALAVSYLEFDSMVGTIKAEREQLRTLQKT
ncbi:hypothetical protein BASA81_008352 [Batrachochytrium salamandrivorans]|nr:hypothetical protein BASA81_008352 [Batrachochytrium salamandrivorans]